MPQDKALSPTAGSIEPTQATKPDQHKRKEKVHPAAKDDTYGELHQENRVVMRHQIALNLDEFRAAPEDFQIRPKRNYAQLQEVTAPFASVIIPNYNGVHLLPPLLEALRHQSFQDFEVIIADDASTDSSITLMEQEYADIDLNMRLLVNRHNLGFAANCNRAAEASYGRILVFLNSDTEPEPAWLAELVKQICANPQAAMVTSKMLLFDQRDMLHTAGDLMGKDGIPRNRGVWQKDVGQFDQDPFVFSGCGGGTAYRKDVWQALGGFDEDFWMYLEDVDFAFRAQLMGKQTIFAPHARLYHQLSATGGDILASYYVGRNTIWNIAKNMPTGLLLRNLPAIIAAQLKVTIDALRNIRGEAARARLRGQLAGLFGLPRQLQKRQMIQLNRRVANPTLADMLQP